MSGSLEVEVDPPVCRLTIDNPEKRNALSSSFLPEVTKTLTALSDRDDVRVVVLTGAGEAAFCSGYDVSELSADRAEREGMLDRAVETLRTFEYPTVARINGDVVGAGVNLITACDLRVAVDDARVGVTAPQLGTVYSYQGTAQLVDVVGRADAAEILLTGELLSAERVERMGLLHYRVGRDRLEETVEGLVNRIGSNAPLSLSGTKQILNAIRRKRSFTEAEREWAAAVREEARTSRDHEEGKRAFAENRGPMFEGR
jgi:enoyl-CoA hydratase/carnithine racemase